MKHIILTLLIASLPFFVQAQESAEAIKPQNLPAYDAKPLHFGFFFGGQANTLRLLQDPSLSAFPPNGNTTFGIRLGVHALYGLSKRLDLKFNPNIAFTNYSFRSASLSYPEIHGNNGHQKTFLEIPLSLRLKTLRLKNNHKLFSMIGAYYQHDISKKCRCVFLGDNVGIQFGVGWDLYTKYFVQSMELSYQMGLTNQKDKIPDYAALDKASMHSLSLSVYVN